MLQNIYKFEGDNSRSTRGNLHVELLLCYPRAILPVHLIVHVIHRRGDKFLGNVPVWDTYAHSANWIPAAVLDPKYQD